MKKIIAAAAALMVSAFAFADGFTNKINLGALYSNTNVTFDESGNDTMSIYGFGANVSWRGTFDNGLTLLADLDVVPNACLDDDDNDEWTDASFALGVGYEWTYDKGCFAVAGVLGDEVAEKEIASVTVDMSTYFLGVNLYGTYMFNDTVGLYGALTAGISLGGSVDYDVSGMPSVDLKAGDFRVAPKAGVVIQF